MFSLSLPLAALMSLLLLAPAGQAAELAEELPQMVGKDRATLNKPYEPSLRSLLPNLETNPWNVWKFTTSENETRYVVFAGQELISIPGNSSASVILFTEEGHPIDVWSFSTGWRIDLKSAAFSFDKVLKAPVLTLTTERGPLGRDVAKQYFAILDDRCYFIRMEDSTGKLLRNNYLSPNHTLGGKRPTFTTEGWSILLKDLHPARRLAALTYLSGIHMDPDHPRIGVASEDVDDAESARAFREHAATAEALATERKSANAWLKEAADLATTKAQDDQ